jgi:16S rRNA (cytosine967-C5)-methyltransferase
LPGRRRVDPGGRRAALDILLDVEANRGSSNALLADLPDTMAARERALATELVYGTLRRRRELDRWIDRVSRRPLDGLDPVVMAALRLALYQILFLTRVPRSAAVNESVGLVRARGGRSAASFANAVLRAACRLLDGGAQGEGPPVPGSAATSGRTGPAVVLAERHSFPDFLVERFLARYGPSECEALLETLNRPASVVLRPTRRSGGPEALIERLASEDVVAVPSPALAGALRVQKGAPQRTEAFRDGAFYIQDEASQIVGLLLEPIEPDVRLVDLCAAPGGKTAGVAERLEGVVGGAGGGRGAVLLASDLSRSRLRLLEDNLRRLGTGGVLRVVMDATRPALRSRFDRILLDAPCSGLGIIRRHPEIRWRRRPEDITACARRQARALEEAVGLAAPGGRIVYAVCSLEPEEGTERVAEVLRTHPDLKAIDARAILPRDLHRLVDQDGSLLTLPHRDDLDGFFAAVLEKHAGSPGR